jgi:RimJ/RimL family protein N-acetyltransferase
MCSSDAPAPYPSELVEAITLPDSRRLRVRPLRRFEDGLVRDLYGRLSPRTRYLRFFSPMPVLPDSVLRLLTCVDYRRRLALLAELDSANGAEVVALGSFAALDEHRAEVGLVVTDPWQQQGIGSALAAAVLRAAEARGFNRFVVYALGENVGLRRLLRRVGDVVSSNVRYGVAEIAFVRRA